MGEKAAVILDHRGLLRLEGADLRGFLQGIVTNDVEKVSPGNTVWAAFLTPQGKFLHEFFLAELDGALMMECEAARASDLLLRLKRYKLRAQVSLEEVTDSYAVAALFGEGALAALGLTGRPGETAPFAGGLAYVDSRLPALGARAVAPRDGLADALAEAGFGAGDLAVYDRLRISLGVPDGSRDMEVEKSILLENGFEELHGVDWDKGCFMGQELTARTKYRALIKKRLLPVAIEGPPPPPGTAVLSAGRDVGTMRSAAGDMGLALLRLEALEGAGPLTAGDARLTPRKPDWANF
jgi:folate-binding protein YgfZ